MAISFIPEKLLTSPRKYSYKWLICAIWTNSMSCLKHYLGGSNWRVGGPNSLTDMDRGFKPAGGPNPLLHRSPP